MASSDVAFVDQMSIQPNKRKSCEQVCCEENGSMNSHEEVRKRVRFNMEDNSVRERYFSQTDLHAAWISDEETHHIMRAISKIIKAVSVKEKDSNDGIEIPKSNEIEVEFEKCLRGIEQFTKPEITKEKKKKVDLHCRTILLVNQMFAVNDFKSVDSFAGTSINYKNEYGCNKDEILSELSTNMSASDVKEACVLARLDFLEARKIYDLKTETG